MERYLIFAGTYYYPCGGFEDFKLSADALESAIAWCFGYLESEGMQWAHVVDTEGGGIVWKGRSDYIGTKIKVEETRK